MYMFTAAVTTWTKSGNQFSVCLALKLKSSLHVLEHHGHHENGCSSNPCACKRGGQLGLGACNRRAVMVHCQTGIAPR